MNGNQVEYGRGNAQARSTVVEMWRATGGERSCGRGAGPAAGASLPISAAVRIETTAGDRILNAAAGA